MPGQQMPLLADLLKFYFIIVELNPKNNIMKIKSEVKGTKNVRNHNWFLLALSMGLFMILGFSSCLSVESKEYKYELTGANSGKLTIKYINIYSIMDEGRDVSAEDFKELLDKYLNGTKIAEDFPTAKNISTRLFEENNQLHGEVTLEFDDLNSARLYQFDSQSPVMMNISTAFDSETFVSSNGVYGNEHMPVVFWPIENKTLTVTTAVSKPDETGVSLVEEYRKWLVTRH